MRRKFLDVQKKKENLGKEVYFLYEKEEKEANFFPHPNQGDEPIINKHKKVKEKEELENQVPAYQDPSLRSESTYQDGQKLS
ncbi:hypothetical protein O181_001390 [Austropuccinia psidii MF-1]|uniref:Uncharacterized protein n=1 Tax=Austropuccinia psidii MF-1 TaxID=1389203 RepID=A0A9Q3BAI4_9BASI|nr:hypothetical protein [Austropuccinia psidii MF-1]